MSKQTTTSKQVKSSAEQYQQKAFPVPPDADADQRWHMIAEAAYFLAERRGFDGGDPVQDWLMAESEIDAVYYYARPESEEEASAYEHLRDAVRKALSKVHDAVDGITVKHAFESGVDEVKRMEHYSADVLRNVTTTLRNDMARATERMGPGWEQFSEQSADTFSVWKDRSRSFLSRSATAVGDWLHHERRGAGH